MNTPEASVTYPQLRLDNGPVVVESLQLEAARELAPAIVGLIVQSYSAQFEGPGRPLPNGTFAAKYQNDAAVKRFQNQVIPRIFELGGAYSVIREPADPSQLVASLKTLPGGTAEKRFVDMIGIAEILTHPGRQQHGYGSALLHAYFGHHNLPKHSKAMLDAFEGSPVNNWYTSLGFRPEKLSGKLELNDRDSLPTRYYVTEEGLTIASIVERQEARRPALRTAIRASST